AIATALLQIAQPSEQQRLVENSRGICDRFTWPRSAQHHLTAYRSLLHCSCEDPRVLC
ncbi:MAG: hypothetical protein ICV62_05400, partial [Cyanobacteria bacterium Co-bin13]|nr:hypothetical protein [Cyanobacteria bacterium Co-bin13]